MGWGGVAGEGGNAALRRRRAQVVHRQVGGDVVEDQGLARRLESFPRHEREHRDGDDLGETPQARHPARRERVDDIDHEVFVAQKGAWVEGGIGDFVKGKYKPGLQGHEGVKK